jgi:hypothetical protein
MFSPTSRKGKAEPVPMTWIGRSPLGRKQIKSPAEQIRAAKETKGKMAYLKGETENRTSPFSPLPASHFSGCIMFFRLLEFGILNLRSQTCFGRVNPAHAVSLIPWMIGRSSEGMIWDLRFSKPAS